MSNEKRCIKCEESMRKRMLHGVEIDCCPGCGGLWLDRGEIRQLADKVDPETLRAINSHAADSDQQPALALRSSSTIEQPCPACAGKLSQATFDTFVVERCVACEGIYLDPGQLAKAMETVTSRGNWAATVVSLADSVATQGSIGE